MKKKKPIFQVLQREGAMPEEVIYSPESGGGSILSEVAMGIFFNLRG